MTIKKARSQFQCLKEKILLDGKVDYNETTILLDFIEPYVRAHNSKFEEFNKIIRRCRLDGKITEDESRVLAAEIDNITQFLDVEYKIERTVFYFLAAFGLIFLFYVFAKSMFLI